MSATSSSTTRRKRSNHLRTKPPNPVSSSHRRRADASRRLKPPKPIRLHLRRTHSEPVLWTVGLVFDHGDGDGDKNCSSLGGVFFSPHSCVDIFAPPPQASPFFSNLEKYNRDSKVVVNVTVEGSPGPVRTLVKLGASVEDTIKLVVDKYSEEGRSPCLAYENVSLFELHQSHFSLESINKKDTIGDVGRRSFYLRKSSSGHGSIGDGTSSKTPLVSVSVFMPNFFARKMNKIGRRMHRLWKVLSCSP